MYRDYKEIQQLITINIFQELIHRFNDQQTRHYQNINHF